MSLNEKVILLDIEGTITSTLFIKDRLFQYIVQHLEDYVEKNWDDPSFKEDLKLLRAQAIKDSNKKGFLPIRTGDNVQSSVVNNVLWQMSVQGKSTALKQLQGNIWKEGYEVGTLRGHLFEDVLPFFDKLTKLGKQIYTYSSGSTEAQHLLFTYSTFGNVSNMITKYFDSKIGPKTSDTSYKNIANDINVKCSDILFLTDVLDEAEAAVKAGCNSYIVVRPGNADLDPERSSKFKIIWSLDELL